MTPRSRLVVLLVAVTTAAAPAMAVAQTPGGEGYEDPFGDEVPQGEATPRGEGGSRTAQTQPGEDPAPLQGAPPGIEDDEATEAQDEPDRAPQPSQAAPAPAELPNTGADAGLIALAGAGMVLSGTGLRLRLRRHGERPA